MSKFIGMAIVALLMISSIEVPGVADAGAAPAADELVPQATCASIKCAPGQVCINALECTPAGDCFHVGRCVALP